MIDISNFGLQLRGAPVTLMSEGVADLLGERVEAGLSSILRTAADIEPSGCIVQSSAIGDVVVQVERFGCTFEQGHHEGGEWPVFLPGER